MKHLLLYAVMLLTGSITAFAQELFEGEINYRNFENHSKATRKLSKGIAYNGARDIKVIIKGYKMRIIDETMHLNTLLLPDEGYVIIYNDLLKRGLQCSYSDYTTTYMSGLGPKPTIAGQSKEYKVDITGEARTLHGHVCGNYKGAITTRADAALSPNVTNVDVWYSTKYKVNPVYNFFLGGLESPGIAMRWTTESHGKVPLFGSIDSFVATEVKSIILREVDESEMQVPSGYELKETDSPFKMLGLLGDTKKYLKKNKMYPTDADVDTDVTYRIDEEWDF